MNPSEQYQAKRKALIVLHRHGIKVQEGHIHQPKEKDSKEGELFEALGVLLRVGGYCTIQGEKGDKV